MPLNKQNLFKNSEINQQQFLKHYWHKKPVLFKNAIKLGDLNDLPNKDKLMQLSCDEDIQSRVVFKTSETQYDVEVGPFAPEDLENFDNYCWNLLISDIDKFIPKSRNILNYFDFIRNWIFDDIMVSTGSVGGTVGPHTDHYDVFLIQTQGQRNWKYGTKTIYAPELMPEQALKLMKNFKADESYILNPGDVLYLPPEVAHYGIATSDDCVTCSIGMRTPSHSELLTSFVDEKAENISADFRFQEPQFNSQPNIGEITNQDLENIKTILINNLKPNDIKEWFGKYITQYRSIFHEFNNYHEKTEVDLTKPLTLSSFSKASYFQENTSALLFVNGNEFKSSLKLAELICNSKQITVNELKELKESDLEIIQTLQQDESLIVIE